MSSDAQCDMYVTKTELLNQRVALTVDISWRSDVV